MSQAAKPAAKSILRSGNTMFLLGSIGILSVDYVYHDSDLLMKLRISNNLKNAEINSTKAVDHRFSNNVEKLLIQKSDTTRDRIHIIVGPNGVGKSASLQQFVNEQRTNKVPSLLVKIRGDVSFPNDDFRQVSETILSSLGIPIRTSIVSYFVQFMSNFTAKPGNLLVKMNQERVNHVVTLLFDVAKNTSGNKGGGDNNTKLKTNIVFDDIDQLVNNKLIKDSGGLSLFSTIAYLSSMNVDLVDTFLAGQNSSRFLEAIRRTSISQAPHTVIQFTDFIPVRMGNSVNDGNDENEKNYVSLVKHMQEKYGYSEVQAKKILAVFSSRLSDLSYFLVSPQRTDDEIEAKIVSKVKETSNILFALIERQSTKMEEKQEVVQILNDALLSASMDRHVSAQLKKNPAFDIVFCSNFEEIGNPHHPKLMFQSLLFAYTWHKEREAILVKCKLDPVKTVQPTVSSAVSSVKVDKTNKNNTVKRVTSGTAVVDKGEGRTWNEYWASWLRQ